MEIIRDCEHLDLSDMNLKRFPINAVYEMKKLKTLNLSRNKELKLTDQDIELIGRHDVKKLVMRDVPKITLEQLMKIISFNESKLPENSTEEGEVRTKTIDISVRPMLTSLDISNNSHFSEFTRTPEFESSHLDIQELHMENCGLGFDELKDIISKFRRLEVLNVSENARIGCNGDPCSIFKPVSRTLRELHMNRCLLNQKWLKLIATLRHLHKLFIGSNKNIGQILKPALGNLGKSLTELSMSDCGLTVSSLNLIRNFKRLRILNISSNQRLNDEALENFDFKNLKNTLAELWIIDCEISKEVKTKIKKKMMKGLIIHDGVDASANANGDANGDANADPDADANGDALDAGRGN